MCKPGFSLLEMLATIAIVGGAPYNSTRDATAASDNSLGAATVAVNVDITNMSWAISASKPRGGSGNQETANSYVRLKTKDKYKYRR